MKFYLKFFISYNKEIRNYFPNRFIVENEKNKIK